MLLLRFGSPILVRNIMEREILKKYSGWVLIHVIQENCHEITKYFSITPTRSVAEQHLVARKILEPNWTGLEICTAVTLACCSSFSAYWHLSQMTCSHVWGSELTFNVQEHICVLKVETLKSYLEYCPTKFNTPYPFTTGNLAPMWITFMWMMTKMEGYFCNFIIRYVNIRWVNFWLWEIIWLACNLHTNL